MLAPLEHEASGPRTRGAAVVVRMTPGADRSDVVRARSHGPLRLLFPRSGGRAAWVVVSSLGGGLVDGDVAELDLVVEPRATCLLATQSSTKIYKGRASQHTRITAAAGAMVLVVPDPVAPFRDASFSQTTTLDLDATASIVLTDVVTAGRVAYGERWSCARIDTTLDVRVAGRRVLLDRVVLDRTSGDLAERFGRFEALGTVLLLGPEFADLAARSLDALANGRVHPRDEVVTAASALGDGVLVRVAGASIEAVAAAVRDLARGACARADENPWSRKW